MVQESIAPNWLCMLFRCATCKEFTSIQTIFCLQNPYSIHFVLAN